MNNPLVHELLKEFGGIEKNDLLEMTNDNIADDEDSPNILTPSSYVDLTTIEKYINLNRNGFSILSMNIQSINSKFEELLTTIKFFDEKYNFKFSAICLQECWLSENTDISQFDIPGYTVFDQPRQCCGHGGLLTYILDEFKGKKKNCSKNHQINYGRVNVSK